MLLLQLLLQIVLECRQSIPAAGGAEAAVAARGCASRLRLLAIDRQPAELAVPLLRHALQQLSAAFARGGAARVPSPPLLLLLWWWLLARNCSAAFQRRRLRTGHQAGQLDRDLLLLATAAATAVAAACQGVADGHCCSVCNAAQPEGSQLANESLAGRLHSTAGGCGSHIWLLLGSHWPCCLR